METIIEVENLCKEFKIPIHNEGKFGYVKDLFSKKYNVKKVVKNISFQIKKGEIVGYLGPNGAGKSTTIKMMTGVLQPTSGKIWVNSIVPYENRIVNARNIGVVFGQRSQLWWALPVIESFKILKDIYQIPTNEYNSIMELYKSVVQIDKLFDKPVRQMSLGQRTLCDILASFLHNPKVVFLDEPTIGLDVSMKFKIRSLIKRMNKELGTTVVLTTHDMGDVDAVCERIIIIDDGACIYNTDIDNLRNFFGNTRTVKLRFDDCDMALDHDKYKLEEIFSSFYVYDDGEWINIVVDENIQSVPSVLEDIRNYKRIKDVRIEEVSTESVIRKLYENNK